MARLNDNIEAAAEILGDTGMVQYTYEQALRHHMEAELMVGVLRPDALIRLETVLLDVGVRQRLSVGWRIKDVLINRGKEGALVDGEPIRLVGRKMLQALQSNLTTGFDARSERSSVVREITYDEKNPESFDVYPGMADKNTHILLEVEAPPRPYTGATLDTNKSDDPTTQERYDPAIRQWILWRFLSRQTDVTTAQVTGREHYDMFLQLLGLTSAVDEATMMSKLEQLR